MDETGEARLLELARDKKPSGAALKLLSIVQKHGFQNLA